MTSPPSTTLRVLVLDDLDPVALEEMRARGIEPEVCTGLSEDELIAILPGAHAVLVRSATKITERVLQSTSDLQLVCRAGVGVDNVHVPTATSRGVVVMNTPTGNTITTAELAISLMCSLARHVPLADRKVREGSWSKKGLMGSEITGKTLGVIGLGRIGAEVAKRGMGLCMNVVAHDPYLSGTGASSPVSGVDLLGLDALLERSDFISLHVPLMDSTRGMIGEKQLALLPKGARVINAARGGLVDEEALLAALETGHLAGAALDVFTQEPPSKDHPLMRREDVILTPHLGAASAEAQRNVAVQAAQQTAAFFLDGVAENAINLPALSATERLALGPWTRLATAMGRFLAQRSTEPVRKVEISSFGEVNKLSREHLERSFLVGLLGHSIEGGVNLVNAPVLAAERGIRLLRGEGDGGGTFQSLLRARASTKAGTESHLVAGTVFGDSPRFVRVDGVHVDLDPTGSMLVTRHRDQTGVVGAIGTALGSANVNIRRVELGPPSHNTEGLSSAFLTLYEKPSAEVIATIAALDPIVSVYLVELG